MDPKKLLTSEMNDPILDFMFKYCLNEGFKPPKNWVITLTPKNSGFGFQGQKSF